MPNGLALLELLEAHPIVTVAMVAERLGVSRTSASSLVNDFISMGLLRVSDPSRQRYRLFSYEPYLEILREGSESL